MNVIDQARQAYAPTQVSIRTERAVEAQLFSQVTSRLRKAASTDPKNFPKLVEALHENRRMWITLATGVADKENALPDALRAQLFYLAEFTEHHSRLVLNRKANVDVLVEINTAVLRGLNAQAGS